MNRPTHIFRIKPLEWKRTAYERGYIPQASTSFGYYEIQSAKYRTLIYEEKRLPAWVWEDGDERNPNHPSEKPTLSACIAACVDDWRNRLSSVLLEVP